MTKLFLALFVAALTLSLSQAAYIVTSLRDVQEIKARLRSEEELQAELFRTPGASSSVYPHVDRGIAWVLNPYLKESSWNAHDEQPYAINELGLRGKEIAKKQPGVTRVLIVGDSVVFGWRLKSEKTIANVLADQVSKLADDSRLEFILVALPGWNVKCEKSFLERHLDLLDPDVVVWSLLRNDLDDAGGAVPPGVLSGWNSPHKEGEAQFKVRQGFMMELDMPAIVDRWGANIRRIQSFKTKYGIPTIVLWWVPGVQQACFETLALRNGLDCPLIVIPSVFLDDRRWRLSQVDAHPTGWATNVLALGILGKLTDLELVSGMEFRPHQMEIMEEFRREEAREFSIEQTARFLSSRLGRVPTQYLDGVQGAKCILFGVEDGRLARNGVLYLRNEAGLGNLIRGSKCPRALIVTHFRWRSPCVQEGGSKRMWRLNLMPARMRSRRACRTVEKQVRFMK